MGLDQYLTGYDVTKVRLDMDESEDSNFGENGHVELGYWRKHPDLNYHIISKFGSRDLSYEEHNCVRIALDIGALESILQAHQADELLKASESLHGDATLMGWWDDSEEGRKKESEDMLFAGIEFLKENENHRVYYYGWW